MKALPSGELQLTESYLPMVAATGALESWTTSTPDTDPHLVILPSALPPYAAAVVRLLLPKFCTISLAFSPA